MGHCVCLSARLAAVYIAAVFSLKGNFMSHATDPDMYILKSIFGNHF